MLSADKEEKIRQEIRNFAHSLSINLLMEVVMNRQVSFVTTIDLTEDDEPPLKKVDLHQKIILPTITLKRLEDPASDSEPELDAVHEERNKYYYETAVWMPEDSIIYRRLKKELPPKPPRKRCPRFEDVEARFKFREKRFDEELAARKWLDPPQFMQQTDVPWYKLKKGLIKREPDGKLPNLDEIQPAAIEFMFKRMEKNGYAKSKKGLETKVGYEDAVSITSTKIEPQTTQISILSLNHQLKK